ncbi:hypothetical protein EVAR_60341_1 [Eumeta japonica]|uniref:Uncharacterized protein n=1 Tax=Eumeta variegata TaxID=151549 RepID=A0A4C1Z8J8_EUMVA|nr:hypothetical protein EVAR_60341_1 [Eumeta japonica]
MFTRLNFVIEPAIGRISNEVSLQQFTIKVKLLLQSTDCLITTTWPRRFVDRALDFSPLRILYSYPRGGQYTGDSSKLRVSLGGGDRLLSETQVAAGRAHKPNTRVRKVKQRPRSSRAGPGAGSHAKLPATSSYSTRSFPRFARKAASKPKLGPSRGGARAHFTAALCPCYTSPANVLLRINQMDSLQRPKSSAALYALIVLYDHLLIHSCYFTCFISTRLLNPSRAAAETTPVLDETHLRRIATNLFGFSE